MVFRTVNKFGQNFFDLIQKEKKMVLKERILILYLYESLCLLYRKIVFEHLTYSDKKIRPDTPDTDLLRLGCRCRPL